MIKNKKILNDEIINNIIKYYCNFTFDNEITENNYFKNIIDKIILNNQIEENNKNFIELNNNKMENKLKELENKYETKIKELIDKIDYLENKW